MRSTVPIEHPPQGSPLYSDPDVAKVLHIPRTGGHARAHSLRAAARNGAVVLAPHNTRASACVGPVVCFLRDPVTRFLSAARRLKMSPAELISAREAHAIATTPSQELLLRPQAWWLDRDLVRVYQMEQMDQVWPMLVEEYDWPADPLPEVGHPNRNESSDGLPYASEPILKRIENAYAEDADVWHEAYQS